MSFFEKSEWYSDLMAEREGARGCEGVYFVRHKRVYGSLEYVTVTSKEGALAIGRPEGRYHTMNTPKIYNLDSYGADDLADEVADELISICRMSNINTERILVVGLGNEGLTPDALGPMAAKRVNATRHVKRRDTDMFYALGCSEISVITPGVEGDCGVDSALTCAAIASAVLPTVVIAIDALCARSQTRLGATVQMSDTGIFSGSGVGARKYELSRSTVGAPVISIGIPTVIDSGVISESDGERMLVTPKEVNALVTIGADIISGGINRAFGIVK